MPLKRLCDRCPSISPKETDVFNTLPNKVNFRMKPPKKGVSEHREDWWAEDLESIDLIAPPPRSAFSRRPHPQFQHLTCWEVTHVEARILQNAKVPYMRNLASTSGHREFREAREDFKLSTLRAICLKDPAERTYDESQQLMDYLANKEFFQHIPPEVMPQIAQKVRPHRIECQETAYTKGDEADRIYLILKGRVLLWDGDSESAKGNKAMRLAGHAVGVADVTEESSTMRIKAQPLRLQTCKAIQKTEMLFLSVQALREAQRTYEEMTLKEKLNFLLKFFKPTKGMSEADLRKESNIDSERALHQLFTSEEVPRHKSLLQEGIKAPLDEATIFIILAGEVELKARGKLVNTLSVGAMLGEDALYDEPYRAAAAAVSERVKFLAINVRDYLQQFEKRDRPMVRPKTYEKVDHSMHVHAATGIDPRQQAETLKRPMKLSEDTSLLHAQEKCLQTIEAPQRVAPRASCALGLPGSHLDLLSARRRRRSSACASQQERPSRVIHQEPGMVALERRVQRQEEASKALYKTHDYHKLHGLHDELADSVMGSTTGFGSTTSTMFPPTRPSSTRSSAVLVSCGTMNIHRKKDTPRENCLQPRM